MYMSSDRYTSSKSIIGKRSALPPDFNEHLLKCSYEEKNKLEKLISNYQNSIKSLENSGKNPELLHQTQLYLTHAETTLKKIQIDIANLTSSRGMERQIYNLRRFTESFNPDSNYSLVQKNSSNSAIFFSRIIDHFFKNYGMNTECCDCYEHIIGYTIQNAKKRADLLSSHLIIILPTVLIQLIFDYLNIDLYTKYIEEIDNLIPKTSSSFSSKIDDKSITFTLPLNKKQGELIVNYFDHIEKNSANMIEMNPEEKEASEAIKIEINIKTLNHPCLMSDLDDTLKTLPQSILDGFRKESKTITLTTAECLQKLDNAKMIIPKNTMVRELSSRIDKLTQHINQNGLEQEEHKLLCDPLIKEINELKIHLSEPPQKRQKYWIFSWFSPPNSVINKTALETDIDEALHGIDIISNKRWHR